MTIPDPRQHDLLTEIVRLETENEQFRRELKRLYDREDELCESSLTMFAHIVGTIYLLTEAEDGFNVQGHVNDLCAIIEQDPPLTASPFFAPVQAKYDAIEEARA